MLVAELGRVLSPLSNMGNVYFLCSACKRYVKIGYSTNPELRRRQLATGNPEHSFLLGSLPSGRIGETLLHMQFADLRVTYPKEWFELKGQLSAYLEMKRLLRPTYGEGSEEEIRSAKVVRRSGWDTLSHVDLDRILVEPAIAWRVYYGCSPRGKV